MSRIFRPQDSFYFFGVPLYLMFKVRSGELQIWIGHYKVGFQHEPGGVFFYRTYRARFVNNRFVRLPFVR